MEGERERKRERMRERKKERDFTSLAANVAGAMLILIGSASIIGPISSQAHFLGNDV